MPRPWPSTALFVILVSKLSPESSFYGFVHLTASNLLSCPTDGNFSGYDIFDKDAPPDKEIDTLEMAMQPFLRSTGKPFLPAREQPTTNGAQTLEASTGEHDNLELRQRLLLRSKGLLEGFFLLNDRCKGGEDIRITNSLEFHHNVSTASSYSCHHR